MEGEAERDDPGAQSLWALGIVGENDHLPYLAAGSCLH